MHCFVGLLISDKNVALRRGFEVMGLFYQTLKRLSDDGRRAIIAIAGNHDMPERIEAPNPLAKECGIILSGLPILLPLLFI